MKAPHYSSFFRFKCIIRDVQPPSNSPERVFFPVELPSGISGVSIQRNSVLWTAGSVAMAVRNSAVNRDQVPRSSCRAREEKFCNN